MFTTIRLMLIALVVATSFAAAADARGRYYHRHRGGGFDVGDALIGGLIVGGLVALATSGRRDRSERTATHVPPAPYPPAELPPLPPEEDPRGDADYRDDTFVNAPPPIARDADADYDRRLPAERAAVDACGAEAEALAGRYGAAPRLLTIDRVTQAENEFRVSGTVRSETRNDVVDSRFNCLADVTSSSVIGFSFENGFAAR